ncbi:hypothetical protein LTS18_011758 [Coniosporium uncinatum]|uniref:Uncharacterized protein n=1 Tax=Coniosporium uncinatum TaxID=93489 RepID=A0ACC3DBY1_9PEZI|nr:hypothetical protein LTS18_011758 [Coniosporium uncinatum]
MAPSLAQSIDNITIRCGGVHHQHVRAPIDLLNVCSPILQQRLEELEQQHATRSSIESEGVVSEITLDLMPATKGAVLAMLEYCRSRNKVYTYSTESFLRQRLIAWMRGNGAIGTGMADCAPLPQPPPTYEQWLRRIGDWPEYARARYRRNTCASSDAEQSGSSRAAEAQSLMLRSDLQKQTMLKCPQRTLLRIMAVERLA